MNNSTTNNVMWSVF